MPHLQQLIEESKEQFNKRFFEGYFGWEKHANGTRSPIISDVELCKLFLESELSLIYDKAVEEMRENIEVLEEYMAVKDNDTHRYQIPRSKKEEWDAFLEIPEDDERSWDVPEWAERIDGMPVKSFKEQVLSTLTPKGEK